MGTRSESFDRLLLDLNAVVISLLEDHPGHEYLFETVVRGFDGHSQLLIFDYYPFRAQHILTTNYDIERHRARNVIQRFVRQPIRIIGAERETILSAYAISAEKNHDVYDSFLVALAREHDANAIVTTDRDFESLCQDEAFAYCNPVPDEVLTRFAEIK